MAIISRKKAVEERQMRILVGDLAIFTYEKGKIMLK